MADPARASNAASLRRDAVLDAVAFAAERLLRSTDWRAVADEVLARLGVAADVSRACVMENDLDAEGRLFVSVVAEWTGPGVTPQLGGELLDRFPWEPDFGRWVQEMRTGRAVVGSVATFPRPERPVLLAQNVVSLAYFPIEIDGRWWGCVGFDDVASERDWSRTDLDGLRTAAALIAAAISRQDQEQQTRETERRYRSMVESIPAVTYVDQPVDGGPTRMTFVSPQVENVLGLSAQRFLDEPLLWFDLMHPEDLARLRAANAFDTSDTTPFDEEYRMRRADGEWVWVHDTSTAVFDDDGAIAYFQGFMVDISRRKGAEHQLQETQERFRTIVENTPIITYQELPWATDDDPRSTVAYVSPQIEQILGYSAEHWSAHPGYWTEIIHPDDLPAVLEESTRTSRTGEPYRQDYRMFAADGRVVWFHDESHLVRDDDGKPLIWQGVMVDISERKEAEEQLRRAQDRLQALVEHIPAVVYMETEDADPHKFYLSPQVEQIFGYTTDEWRWTADFWVDHLHPEDRERVEALDRHVPDEDTFSVDYRFRRADGTYAWVHDQAVFVSTAEGDGFWQGFLFDITERKQAEEQLLETERVFRATVEHLPAVVYRESVDESPEHFYMSPQVEHILGYTAEEWTYDAFWEDRIHPDDREHVLEVATRTSRSKEPYAVDYRFRRKDGTYVWVHDEATLEHEPGQATFWQGFMIDVTERRQAEEQLARSLDVEREATRRLRALDEMKNTFLQAVSHDLRTPLAAILGLAITLERGDVQLEEDDARDLARRIADNARRLDRLVTNLLDLDRLARGIVTPKLQPTDVGSLVRRVLAESELISDARLRTDIQPIVVPIDAAKVERVVENLLANMARHTPETATVWVTVGPVDEGVLLMVEDDGPGIEPDLRETIFEPFQQGPDAPQHSPGVGVGLTLVRRFAELHGGRAWVEERAGGGASFHVVLPSDPVPPVVMLGEE